MAITPYNYNIFFDFIESYLPSGFLNVRADDPIMLRMEELMARAAAEGRAPTSAELAALREQTRVELQKILPPAQLEEFLLRYSQNAAELRAELGDLRYFNASPEEFRALFRARDQFDQKLAALADSTDPNDIRQRQSLEAQRERAIKLALGERRYALYQQLQDPDYRTAAAPFSPYPPTARVL